MLGIIIGVSSFIMIMALGTGSTNKIANQLYKMGENSLDISTNLDKARKSDLLTINDVKSIQDSDNNIISVSPQDEMSGSIELNDKSESCYITFVNENYIDTGGINIIYGKFFYKNDYEDKKQYIVLDSLSCKKLFKTSDAIGKSVKVNIGGISRKLIICGVFDIESYFSGIGSMAESVSIPGFALVPFSIKQDFGIYDNYSAKISAILSDMSLDKQVADNITKVLSIKHNNMGKNMYIIERTNKQYSSLRNILNTVTLLVASVAFISLIVGGIGIMNIMLVSVAERTKEIGLRKSLGATDYDIMKQFLVESLIMCFFGGIIGIAFGIIVSTLISNLTVLESSPNILSIIISLVFSSLVGVFFGLYPAKKASSLNPIDSLRL